jgi:hypothetical protein
MHKLVKNTILALYELELTWDLWVCSCQDALAYFFLGEFMYVSCEVNM